MDYHMSNLSWHSPYNKTSFFKFIKVKFLYILEVQGLLYLIQLNLIQFIFVF